MKTKLMAAGVALASMTGAVAAETPGVTADSIIIGGAHDLSGIFAPFSVPAVKGAQHYIDQVNAAGGVHGRQIEYVVEDHGYQIPKALQAANKLINRNEVFAMMLNLGTPHNEAMFKMMEPKGIPNTSPLSAARQMAEPLEDWKFAGTAPYYDQVRATVGYLIENEGKDNFCAMILPTDFGEEIRHGMKDELGDRGLEYIAESTHKPDEKDFVGALGKLREQGCSTVGLALGISQAITAIVTADKMGFKDMTFFFSSAGFLPVTAAALGQQGVTVDVYAGAGYPDVTQRMDVPEVKAWADSFTAATGEKAEIAAVLGYSAAVTLVKALEAAGPDLTHESFIAGMETLNYMDTVGGYHVDYSAEDHVGGEAIFISKANAGKWNLLGTVDEN